MKPIIFPFFVIFFIIACSSETLNDLSLNEYQIVQEPLVSSVTTTQTLASTNANAYEGAATKSITDNDKAIETTSDQRLVELTLESINENEVKEIKDGVFQTVVTEMTESEENIISINFFTWINDKKGINLIDASYFNDDKMAHGKKIGEYYNDLWIDKESFFLSYHDLMLDIAFLETAENGQMYTSNISIGLSKEDLISALGSPIISDWYHGGTYYFYNDIGFILDDKEKVVSINMPGNRVKITLEEVPILLGEPTTIEYFEKENTIFYSYEVGQYTLSFESVSEDENIANIWLN